MLRHGLLGAAPTVAFGFHVIDSVVGSSSLRVTLQDETGSGFTCHVDANADDFGLFLDIGGADASGIAGGTDQQLAFGADAVGSTCIDSVTLHGPLALAGSNCSATIALQAFHVALSYIATYDVR